MEIEEIETKTRAMTVQVDRELLRRVKVFVAANDLRLRDVVDQALRDVLQKLVEVYKD